MVIPEIDLPVLGSIPLLTAGSIILPSQLILGAEGQTLPNASMRRPRGREWGKLSLAFHMEGIPDG